MYSLKPREGGSWLYRHSLSLSVGALTLVHAAITSVMGYHWAWVPDQETHGQPVTGFWSADYWQWYSVESNLSLLAEPWGFLVGVLFTKWFYESGSPESKEN
jgi:hypothetical protein